MNSSDTPARHALTVLTRLAGRRPDETGKLAKALAGRLNKLGGIAVDVAIETGDPVGRVLAELLRDSPDPDLSRALVNRIPGHTTALIEAAIVIAEQARIGCQPEDAPRLAAEHATRLADAGRRSESLAVAHQALNDARAAAVDLAPSVWARLHGTCADALELNGRLAEAADHAEQAAALWRSVAADERHAAAPLVSLATALSRRASIASRRGEREAARSHALEAAALLADLQHRGEENTRRPLAACLSNLASFEVDLNLHDEAIGHQFEAIAHYRVLHDRDPDAFRAQLAISCNNLANSLSLMRRFGDAVPLAREAVEYFELLARGRPRTFGEYLAIALNTLSNRLSDVSDSTAAIEASRRSVELLRELLPQAQEALEPVLARSLHSLAYRLYEVRQLDEALSVAGEAIAIRTRLLAGNQAFAVPLSMSRAVRASILDRAGENSAAAEEIERAMHGLAQALERHGRALGREAREIGARYLTLTAAAGRVADSELLARVRAMSGISEFLAT